MSLQHLVTRFVRALWPGPPRRANRAWVAGILTPAERALWEQMPSHDQRHSVAVARRAQRHLAGTEFARECWLAAALLHDVGKLDADLSIPGRVVATLLATARGRERMAAWADRRGVRGRIGRYTEHPRRGAVRIARAGGRAEAAAWAAVHHGDGAPPTIPAPVVAALRAADED